MKKYYVYELIDPRNNKPFYIGKGSGSRIYYHIKEVKRNRIPNGNVYLERKIKKILKIGLKIQYKKIFLTDNEEKAYKKEIERINEIGIKKLCNLTYGGEGVRPTEEIRKKISIETKKILSDPKIRKKMSDGRKGKPPWNKDKKGVQVAWNKGLTKETSDIVKKYSEVRIGQKRTEEQKQRISDGRKGKAPWNKGKKNVQVAWNKGLTKETDERIKNYAETMKTSKKCRRPAWNKGLTKETDKRVKKQSETLKRKK